MKSALTKQPNKTRFVLQTRKTHSRARAYELSDRQQAEEGVSVGYRDD